LTDPRTQNIPLILETPSFEKPKEVWSVEISVLNRLSEGAGGVEAVKQPGVEVKAPSSEYEVDSEKLVEEIREAVKSVSKATTAKPKVAKRAATSRKRKLARDDGDEDEDQSECEG
jgi:AP endonuclease-1